MRSLKTLCQFQQVYPEGDPPEHKKNLLLLINIPLKIDAEAIFRQISAKCPVNRVSINKNRIDSSLNAGFGVIIVNDHYFYNKLLADGTVEIVHEGKTHSIEVVDYYTEQEKIIRADKMARRTVIMKQIPDDFVDQEFLAFLWGFKEIGIWNIYYETD
jgi:hypothetical protein